MTARRCLLWIALTMGSGCSGGSPLGPASNRSPEIRSVTLTPAVVPVGGTAMIQVDAIDPDGDPLFYLYVATAGSVVPDRSNPARATYVQNGTPRDSDTLTVRVTDSRNASAVLARAIALQGNRPPVVTLGTLTGATTCHPPCGHTFVARAVDPDGDPLSYAWSGCAEGTESTSRCELPTLGVFTATVAVSDGRGNVTVATGELEGVNQAPWVTGGREIFASQARLNVSYGDHDGDPVACGWWGNCQCTGSDQSFNLDCLLPVGLSSCFQRCTCTDSFGASADTTFTLRR